MILVTGCLGFIGSRLCKELVKERKVIGIDLFKDRKKVEEDYPFVKSNNFKLERIDITDSKQLEKLFNENKVGKVIHLAAIAKPRAKNVRPETYLNVNVFGTLNLLEECKKHKVRQLVFVSTSNVYGKTKPPFKEEDSCNPLSVYGMSKRSAELLCQVYAYNYSIPITCLRLSTVYGENGRKDMAVEKFIRLIMKNKPIPRFGSGSDKRDYVYVGDVVNAIIKALENPFDFEIVNIGSGKAVSINGLIELIEKKAGIKARIKTVKEPASELPVVQLDCSKAKKLLNWQPKTSIEKGIERVWNAVEEDLI